jgi:uncharacterized protein YkwD
MMFLNKNSRKLLIASLVFLSATLFCNVAKAQTLTASISNIFNFINNNIIAQVKSDFCKQYILSISTGEWKAGEFRTNLGKQVCTSYTIPSASSTVKIVQEPVQTLNSNATVSKTETPSTTSVNTPSSNANVPNPNITGTDLNSDEIIYLTNQEREENDSTLVNLQKNNTLSNIAVIRVKDMFSKQYFAHISPTGDDVSKEAATNGYGYITIGENIALGNFGSSQGLLTAWMNSAGHRANILDKNYTEIGVDAEQGTYQGQSVWIAAQIFGKPLSDCTEPDATIAAKVSQYKISANSLMTTINNLDVKIAALPSTDTQDYNADVAEKNATATLYNNLATEIKTLVAQYNAEVTAFNSCIQTQ